MRGSGLLFRRNRALPSCIVNAGLNKENDMVKTWLSCILVSLSVSGLVLAAPALGEELLVNGDFEIGTPEEDKPDSFACNAWRRLLWKETLPNSWLTNGKLDRPVGNDNQALEYRWGATSVCQYFSATALPLIAFHVLAGAAA